MKKTLTSILLLMISFLMILGINAYKVETLGIQIGQKVSNVVEKDSKRVTTEVFVESDTAYSQRFISKVKVEYLNALNGFTHIIGIAGDTNLQPYSISGLPEFTVLVEYKVLKETYYQEGNNPTEYTSSIETVQKVINRYTVGKYKFETGGLAVEFSIPASTKKVIEKNPEFGNFYREDKETIKDIVITLETTLIPKVNGGVQAAQINGSLAYESNKVSIDWGKLSFQLKAPYIKYTTGSFIFKKTFKEVAASVLWRN